MKNFLFLLLFTFGVFVIVHAQPTPPTPPQTPGVSETHSTSSSQTKINMNLGADQKLKLNSTDNRFSMFLDFKKEDHAALRKLLVQYLDQPSRSTGNSDQWVGDEKQFKYLLKNNKLNVTIDKTLLGAKELDKLYQLTMNTFETIGWQVDLEQL